MEPEMITAIAFFIIPILWLFQVQPLLMALLLQEVMPMPITILPTTMAAACIITGHRLPLIILYF